MSLRVPQDICDWVSPAEVISWIRQELKACKEGVACAHLPAGFDEALFAVLALAYCRGIFDHAEIAQRCHSDSLFRSLAGPSVFSEEVMSSRRKDRELLVKLIREIFIRAARQRLNLDDVSPAMRRQIHEDAVDRLDNARHIDRGEDV